MTEQEIEKYRQYIKNMSDLERENYFKDVSIGKIKVPYTGYPHLDRVWLKNYDKDFLTNIIRNYTKEAGVRELERCLTIIIRKILTNLVLNNKHQSTISIKAKDIDKYLYKWYYKLNFGR